MVGAADCSSPLRFAHERLHPHQAHPDRRTPDAAPLRSNGLGENRRDERAARRAAGDSQGTAWTMGGAAGKPARIQLSADWFPPGNETGCQRGRYSGDLFEAWQRSHRPDAAGAGRKGMKRAEKPVESNWPIYGHQWAVDHL